MSPGGAGGLDLNCDTEAVLDNPESGGQAFDAIGDEKRECVRGAADGKVELAGGEEEIGRSELGGVSEESRERSEVGQGDLVAGRGQDSDGKLSSGEKEAESCDRMLLEMDTGMKGSEKPVTVLAEGFESADSSNQGVHLEYGSCSDQNKGSDLYDHGALGTRNKELAVEFDGGEISEVDKGEKRSSELVAVSSEGFALVEVAGQAMDLGDKPGCDQKQGTDVGAQALVRTGEDPVAVSDDGGGPEDERLEGSSVLREQQVEISVDFVDEGGQVGGGESGPWEREDKIESRSGKLLEVYMGEKRTTELVAVSAEGFEAFGACSQVMDLGDGSDVNQKLRADVDAVCMGGTDEEVAASFGGVGHEDEMLEGSSILGKEPIDVQEDMVVGHVQDVDDELSPGKLETGVQSHRGELLEEDTGEKRSAELVCISGEGFYVVGSSNQAMELEDGNGSDQKRGIVVDAEFRTNENSVAVSVGGGEPKDSRLEGSSILVKEQIEDGEDTSGTESQVKDLAQPMEIEDAGNNAKRHDGQIQQEFGGDQRRGADVGAEGMVGRSEEAYPVVSVGGVGPENERLESSSSLGDKQLEIEDYTNGMRPVENNVVHLVKIASGGVDAIRHAGHVQDSVHHEDVEDLDPGEGVYGDQKSESYVEIDAKLVVGAVTCQGDQDSVHHEDVEDLDPGEGVDGDQKSESYVEIDAKLVVGAVTCQGDQILGLEGAQNFEGEQLIVKYTSDGPQTVGKVVNSQKSGDRVHDDMVCDLVAGHSDDIEGEIVGGSGHNLAEVNSEFTAGKEDIMEKGLACLQESLETANNSLNHALVEGDPVGDSYHYQAMLVTYNKQEDISLGIFQGASLDMRRGDTSTDHWSASEEIEDPQAFYVENDQKTCGQNSTAAGETVQIRDSILIAEGQDLGSRQIYGEIFITAAGGTNVCDVSGTTLAPEAANMEAWSAEVHTIDKNIEKKLEVVLEANGSVMDLTSAELENEGAHLNFDHQGCKTDSSFMMVSCKGEEAHAASTQSCDGFLVEKGCSNMEDSNSHLSISMPESSEEPENLTFLSQQNEPSSGCQDVQPSDVPSRECKIVKDLEAGVGTPALEHALQAVDEPIDSTQSLQDGKNVHLKEAGNQSEECNGTRTQLASLSRQATYYLSVPEKEGFSISDLVWGKVKSHPWWPGQIVDLSDASKLAIKYQKKDHFLVAYFGDKTFAWCEESRLKPFQLYFLQMEKQSSSESFLRAVGDILMEISRRIQLVMTCLCLPEEAYSDIKYQKLENAGVNGKTVCTVIDRYEVVNCFHTDKLLEYIRALAELPTGADRLDLTVAQAQLKAFYLSKGYTELPAFTNGSGLVENDFEITSSVSKELKKDDLEQSATLSNLFSAKGKSRGRDGIPLKQKHIVEDGRRQQSPSELVEEKATFLHENGSGNGSVLQEDENCISSGNKRKVVDSDSNDIGRSKIKKLDSIADKEYKSLPTSNISFKVGEFISRAASKLTGGHPIRKCHGGTSEGCLSRTDYRSIDDMDVDDFLDIPFDNPKVLVDISGDYPPSNEMLSQLCLAARNPMKGCNLLSAVISFFTAFRNAQVSNFSIEKNIIEKPRAKRGRKKKIVSDLATPDMSTPDHMKDSYWSDVIFPEKDAILNPPKRRGRKRRKPVGESSPSHLLSSPPDCEPKLHIGTVCPHAKHRLTAERPIIIVEEKIVDERTPTAVILYFNSSTSLPSETDIIRIFSRYGPLKEAETYIERKTNSAMVVFKKRADAEMAFSSAEKFSAFGPALVSYRLKNFTSQPSPKNAVKNESDDAPIKAESGSGAAFIENLVKASDKRQVEATMGEECSVSVPNETEAVNIAARDDDLGTEQSYFVQTQMDGGNNTQVENGCAGGFSEFVRYQVVDVVVSDSIKDNTVRKEPSVDIPALMETGTVSDHFLLESLEQELSYFDLDHAGSGAISDDMQVETVCQDFSVSIVEHVEVGVISDLSPVEVTDEKSSLHLLKKEEPEGVSNDATFKSVGQESCVCAPAVAKTATGAESAADIVVPGSCDFVEDQLEKQIVLEKTSQHEAVDHELFDIAPDQPEENHCFDSAPAQVSTGALVGSLVTIDVQSQLKSSDYVQDNQGIGIHSCVMEVQVIAEDPSQSVPAQREIRAVSDAMQVEVMGRVPYVSVTIAEEAGMPSCVTQAALPEDKSNSVHDEAMNGRFSDSAEVGCINKESYDLVPSAVETGIISDATHVENQDKESSVFILSAGKIGNVSQVESTGEEPSGVVKVHEGGNLSDTLHKPEDQEGFL